MTDRSLFQPADVQAAQRRRLAFDLNREPDADIRAAMARAAVVAFGGTLIEPDISGTWGPLYAELSILGLSHTGADLAEAIANWIKAAHRCAPQPSTATPHDRTAA